MMDKRTEKQIAAIYMQIFKKVFNAKPKVGKLTQQIVDDELLRLSTSVKFNEFCEKFAKELSKRGLSKKVGVWRKYFQAAKANNLFGIDFTWQKYQEQTLKKLIEENFKMIKSIPSSIMNFNKYKYVDTLFEQVANGTLGRGAFEKQLAKHGIKHAKIVARTETAKLQTGIDRIRSTELGSVAYIWHSTKDHRTRESHKQMNECIVFWRDVPTEKPLLDGMYGDAGEFPNCRCDVEPIFDERDLKKNSYNVYDYRKHKRVRIGKHAIMDLLRSGGFN